MRWIFGPLGGRATVYQRLPDAVPTEIAPHFGIRLAAGGIEAMHTRALRDAKSLRQDFVLDAQCRQQQASAEHLDPLCVRFQAL